MVSFGVLLDLQQSCDPPEKENSSGAKEAGDVSVARDGEALDLAKRNAARMVEQMVHSGSTR